MSPEQLMADPEIDGRSDIYSLGCVVYEMLTGQLPFMGSSGAPELMPRLIRTPDRAQALRSDVPAAVDEVVRKALEPKPADRFASAAEFRDALVAPVAPYARFNWKLRPMLAAIGVLLVIAAGSFFLKSRSKSVVLQSNVIGVLPFELGVPDTALNYMRTGMATMLEHRLNGDAGTRVAPPRNIFSVLTKLGHKETDNLRDEEALEVGERAGVGLVLRGSVVGNSKRIEIVASLLSVPDGELRAQVHAAGDADSAQALADTIAAELLLRTAGEEEQRLPSLKRVPMEALRAYIDGQAEVRYGRFANAVAKFERALEIDSTFAMAAIGYVVAADYITVGAEGPERAIRIAWDAQENLSKRDRAYVVARAGAHYPALSDMAEQVVSWESAVNEASDRADMWYQLGERQFLYSNYIAGDVDRRAKAVRAFDKAIEIDSTFTPALERLVELRARSGDTAETRRLLRLLARNDIVSDKMEYLRWRAAIAFGDSLTVLGIRERLPRVSRESISQLYVTAQLDGVRIDDAVRAIKVFSDRAATSDEQGDAAAARYLLALNRGRPREAAPDLMKAAGTRNHMVPILQAQAIRDAIWSSADSSAALEAVDQLSQTVAGTIAPTPVDNAVVYIALCAVEEWKLAHGDTRTAGASIGRLKELVRIITPARIGGDVTPLLNRTPYCPVMLEAMLAVAEKRADASRVVARLDSVLERGPMDIGAQSGGLVSARLHKSLNDPRGALRAVRRRPLTVGGLISLAAALLEEGRLAEEIGNNDAAIRAYRHYLALRTNPEPSLDQEVAAVREALRRLQPVAPAMRSATEAESMKTRRADSKATPAGRRCVDRRASGCKPLRISRLISGTPPARSHRRRL